MSILLENLTKRYDGHPVVNNVSLEIANGEFFVLLGSSGSGKTTILSMIAGLTPVDSGRIFLHGREVTDLPPQARGVGFVFQNYALFQHMSIADNVEFGLSVRGVSKARRAERRDELLELVGLAGLGQRMPAQLSGGQQQRVALARALAAQPEVLLLDEPLGALDAKIRLELRRSLKSIQRQLGIAAILVTHDQEEAFDLGDRIGVMSYGRLLEVGAPQTLYQEPQTEFVATFLGVANIVVGERPTPELIRAGSLTFFNQAAAVSRSWTELPGEGRVQVLFRPEDVALAAQREELDQAGVQVLGQANVEETAFGGAMERLRLRLPPMSGIRAIAPPVPFGQDTILVEASRSPDQSRHLPLKIGDSAWLGVRRLHALTHPGLNILILSDGGLRAQAAEASGGQIARLAHARVTLAGYTGSELPGAIERLKFHLEDVRKSLSGGAAGLDLRLPDIPTSAAEILRQMTEQQVFDLVIAPYTPGEDIPFVEDALQMGAHHLLLIPRPQDTPTNALICATIGEPGKEDVLFAGRLLRHLGASAALLTVLPGEQTGGGTGLDVQPGPARLYAERFLKGGIRSLSLLGVQARAIIRTGDSYAQILSEINEVRKTNTTPYDLLVLGAPLANGPDRMIRLTGVTAEVLASDLSCAALIVRSHFAAPAGWRLYDLAHSPFYPREGR